MVYRLLIRLPPPSLTEINPRSGSASLRITFWTPRSFMPVRWQSRATDG